MGINEVYNTIAEGLEMAISYFANPKKRIYVGYLLSSGLLAYYIYYSLKPKTSFLGYVFHKKIWWGKSAFVDYAMVFFNSFIKILLIAPFLIYGLYLAFYTDEYLLHTFGKPTTSLTQNQTLIYYTIALIVVGDFASYIVHALMHKVSFLWEFHKVHHSATKLNPITQYRIHPVELMINNARGILVFGVLTGVFDYLSYHQVNKLMFLGVNAFSFVFFVFGANLRHSHVQLKYPVFLEKIFISPFQHQIHHSSNPVHYNKNMGAKLAIWDWMFGTLTLSKSTGSLKFGLGNEDARFDTFWKNLWQPFKNLWVGVKKRFS